jgi:hypothetical protein
MTRGATEFFDLMGGQDIARMSRERLIAIPVLFVIDTQMAGWAAVNLIQSIHHDLFDGHYRPITFICSGMVSILIQFGKLPLDLLPLLIKVILQNNHKADQQQDA